MKTALELIANERQRQIEKEGYTPEHDTSLEKNDLFIAACCYHAAETERAMCGKLHNPYDPSTRWPWAAKFWKPTPHDRIRELVKAGALFKADYDLNGRSISLDYMNTCAFEIERLQRKEGKE